MGDDIKEIKDEEKEKLAAAEQEQNGQEPSNANTGRRNNAWVPGLILIGLGLVFFISNVTGFHFQNWWALFILIPGIASFVNAWNAYREDGRWSKRARGGLVGGSIISLVAIIFLFNLDWSTIWPAFLILIGANILLGGWLDR
jgi:hypothetical protein